MIFIFLLFLPVLIILSACKQQIAACSCRRLFYYSRILKNKVYQYNNIGTLIFALKWACMGALRRYGQEYAQKVKAPVRVFQRNLHTFTYFDIFYTICMIFALFGAFSGIFAICVFRSKSAYMQILVKIRRSFLCSEKAKILGICEMWAKLIQLLANTIPDTDKISFSFNSI